MILNPNMESHRNVSMPLQNYESTDQVRFSLAIIGGEFA